MVFRWLRRAGTSGWLLVLGSLWILGLLAPAGAPVPRAGDVLSSLPEIVPRSTLVVCVVVALVFRQIRSAGLLLVAALLLLTSWRAAHLVGFAGLATHLLVVGWLPERSALNVRTLIVPLVVGLELAAELLGYSTVLFWERLLSLALASLAENVSPAVLGWTLVALGMTPWLIRWARGRGLDVPSLALIVSLAGVLSWSPADEGTAFLWLSAALAVVLLLGILFRLAYHDELTGLPARRAFNDSVAALRGGYSLAMVDIDHFKRINDRYGHDVGDQVLRKVGARLARIDFGRAYRYGGEEFAVVMPATDQGEAVERLEELRELIAKEPFGLRTTPRGGARSGKSRSRRGKSSAARKSRRVTVSIGVAQSAAGRSASEVLKAADQALYRAKRAGRNRVTRGRLKPS